MTGRRVLSHVASLLLLLLLLSSSSSVVVVGDESQESIDFTFESSNVLRLTASMTQVDNSFSTFNTYPKILGQILKKYPATRVSLDIQSSGNGIQLQGTGIHSDLHWSGIQAELGGLFSFSTTTSDVSSFATETRYDDNDGTRYKASYPREELCTENLTPWVQILPCRAHAGIGALLSPRVLMTRDLKLSLEFGQLTKNSFYVNQVLEAKVHLDDDITNSFSQILWGEAEGKEESVKPCPVMTIPSVMNVTWEDDFFSEFVMESTEDVASKWYEDGSKKRKSIVWDRDGGALSQKFLTTKFLVQKNRPPKKHPVSVHRYVTGVGQVRGGVTTHLVNNHETLAMDVWYREELPWFLRTYYSTLRTSLELDLLEFQPAERTDKISHPNVLVVHKKNLLPKTELVISIEFEKVFLALAEHPPDANRGADIIPGVAYFFKANSSSSSTNPFFTNDNSGGGIRIQSESLLVPLPVPDFSMPYNVITLSSTVLAFYFGAMLNTLLRRKRPTRLEQAISQAEKQKAGPWYKRLFKTKSGLPSKK